jgi:hypothetical protein
VFLILRARVSRRPVFRHSQSMFFPNTTFHVSRPYRTISKIMIMYFSILLQWLIISLRRRSWKCNFLPCSWTGGVLRCHVQCPRKSAHILNVFVEKINRARIVHFSPHETIRFGPHFFPFHCTWTSARFVACCVFIFSDEATFQISGHLNRHNCRVWCSEDLHVYHGTWKNQRRSQWYAITHRRVTGPFFFVEDTVTNSSYLDMLEWCAVSQIRELSLRAMSEQDGALPHWVLSVRQFVNTFPARWTGRDEPFTWPPRSRCTAHESLVCKM